MSERTDAGQADERNEGKVSANVSALYSAIRRKMASCDRGFAQERSPSSNRKRSPGSPHQKRRTAIEQIVVSANAERNMMNGADTMIIRAGPYGLSLAAHLRAKGRMEALASSLSQDGATPQENEIFAGAAGL